jgi:threonyl-tRNA synthetase
MNYINEEGQPARPIMIHRAILGSIERFIGTLIEHYAGAFPVWLSPVQVVVIPIKSEHLDFSRQIKENLQSKGVRVIIDNRNESLNKRIRENTLKKIPYLLIIGDSEILAGAVAVRKRGGGDMGCLTVDAFIQEITQDVAAKR